MTQKIYFICTGGKKPAGGVKQIYRQVDILNANGFDAQVIHKRKGFRHTWFKNETKIIYNYSIFWEIDKISINKKNNFIKNLFKSLKAKLKTNNKIDKNGILVFPEIYGPNINFIFPKMKKVIFNQNCFYTFNNSEYNTKYNNSVYNSPNLLGIVTVSENSKKYIEFAFPNTEVFRIKLGIDNKKFYYNQKLKKKLIAFMPRKRSDDINQIIQILNIRGNLKDWKFIEINNKTEDEVASILNKSSIFLSLNHIEGFGLPPAEAMGSGCIIIGFTGHGGDEYFNPNFTYKIEDGNIIQFVKQIENIINVFEQNRDEINFKVKEASTFIKNNYSMEEEEASIISTWNKIIP